MAKSDAFELKTSTEIFDPRGAISGKYDHFWPVSANIWPFLMIKLPVIAPNFFIGVSEAPPADPPAPRPWPRSHQ